MRISDWSSDVCSSDLFPMFEKIDVNGPFAHPLYQWLVEQAPGILGSRAVKWNFTKFLMDRNGNPVVRYAPTMEPNNIRPAIERYLARSEERRYGKGRVSTCRSRWTRVN